MFLRSRFSEIRSVMYRVFRMAGKLHLGWVIAFVLVVE